MEVDSSNYAEAIAIKDGKIIFVGKKADAEKLQGDSTTMTDLKGKTMLPGFIDGHSHFAAFSNQAIGAQILPSPDANVNSIPDLINELKNWPHLRILLLQAGSSVWGMMIRSWKKKDTHKGGSG
ncbi:MAG: amidohydrolase family protein [Ignavibacteria bacterium]